MERIGFWLVVAALLLLATSGCNVLEDIFGPDMVRVELRNDGEFPVDLTLYYGDQQDAPRDILTTVGTELQYSVQPGETVTFSRDCADLQAIVIDDADLRVIGQVGPETDSNVLRDGDDFGCGDVIEFTFDHSGVLVDFNVQTSVRENQQLAGESQ
jgi:hypothetical protein